MRLPAALPLVTKSRDGVAAYPTGRSTSAALWDTGDVTVPSVRQSALVSPKKTCPSISRLTVCGNSNPSAGSVQVEAVPAGVPSDVQSCVSPSTVQKKPSLPPTSKIGPSLDCPVVAENALTSVVPATVPSVV